MPGSSPALRPREAPWTAVAAATAFRLRSIRQRCKGHRKKGGSCGCRPHRLVAQVSPPAIRFRYLEDAGEDTRATKSRLAAPWFRLHPAERRVEQAPPLRLRIGLTRSNRT